MSKPTPFTHKQIWIPLTGDELAERRRQRENHGAARDDETCEQRNMRMGWGCKCHGATFCPDSEFSHYENDQPVYRKRP